MSHRARAASGVAGLVVVLAGCTAIRGPAPSGDPVMLLIYDGAGDNCLVNAEPRLLIADAESGTALPGDPPMAVYWPHGSSGRRVGSEVAVYNAAGQLVAMTGRYWWTARRGSNLDPQDVWYMGCADRPLDPWDPRATPAPPPP
ncbi:MAG TPA: hypothetical protein VFW20_03110 [Candidatus Limnocylindrales bacterium]|nr:hypothetical protein [Candidatus Limnocylindrales bacterium]